MRFAMVDALQDRAGEVQGIRSETKQANHQLFLNLLIQKIKIIILTWIPQLRSALTSKQDGKCGGRICFCLLALSFPPAVTRCLHGDLGLHFS